MTDFFPFIVVGIVNGSVYGLASMGLVLTYKTSGIFNFAHGAVATIAAFAFYEMHTRGEVPWPVAFLLAVVVLGVILGLMLARLARALASVSPAMQIVATVGLLIAVQTLAIAFWGAESRSVSPYFPTRTLQVGEVNVGVDQLIVFVIALGAAAGLFLFFRSSRLGLSMQAVVDDPDLLAMGGTSPLRVRTLAWMIGSGFACLSGVLLVPFTGLDAAILTLLVVQSFGAAAVGAFSSLPLSYAGGLAVGLTASLSTRYIGGIPWLSGFPSAVPFLFLFIVLLVVPRHRLADIGAQLRLLRKPPPSFSPKTKLVGLGATGVVLIVVPELVGTRLPVFTNGLVFVIVFLSLHLLVRTSGQVSLAHASFAAVGAAAFAHLIGGLGLPWTVALVAAGLLTVPVGALVAIPAIRLSGVYLAAATFGFAILLERLVYPMELMFGLAGVRNTPRPQLFGMHTDTGYYYTVLVIAGLMVLLATAVIRSRLGRLLRAMSDAPVALTTGGTNVNLTRVLVFCISAFMAGLAGTLFAGLNQSVNAATFTFFTSLQWLAVFAIAGRAFGYAPIPTALLGGVAMAIAPSYFTNPTFLKYLPALFGVAALLNALLTDRVKGHRGRAQALAEQAERKRKRSPVTARIPVPATREALP